MPITNPRAGCRESQTFILIRNPREICRRRTWRYSEIYCGYFIRRRCGYGGWNNVNISFELPNPSDKTVSSIATFILAMVLYPDVLHRAQQEIDRVIGNDRLPSFKDRDNLPYIDALCKEVFRWENVVPVGSYSKPIFTSSTIQLTISTCSTSTRDDRRRRIHGLSYTERSSYPW